MAESDQSLLIVEDDPALSGYLGAALGEKGFSVHMASSRMDALACMESATRIRLVLLDLGLPPAPSTMDEGLALLDEILAKSPSVKVVVLTGQDENSAALEAVRRGAFDFLVEPASVSARIITSFQAQYNGFIDSPRLKQTKTQR